MAEIKVERRKGIAGWLWPVLGLLLVGLVGLAYWLTRGGAEERAAARATAPAATADCTAVQVHFATDSSVIPDADQGQLTRMAQCLKTNQSMKLTIAGTTDERGTPEHNAELGEKRAMAVAHALSGLGVSTD